VLVGGQGVGFPHLHYIFFTFYRHNNVWHSHALVGYPWSLCVLNGFGYGCVVHNNLSPWASLPCGLSLGFLALEHWFVCCCLTCFCIIFHAK